MKITKLQHELHGIHVVDSGAVLPRPHHLNFDQFGNIPKTDRNPNANVARYGTLEPSMCL